MDGEVWIGVLFMLFLCGMAGAIGYSAHTTHVERMHCMDLGGEWSDNNCRRAK